MRRSRCSIEQAREVCLDNFRQFRDRLRFWVSTESYMGGYVRIEVDQATYRAHKVQRWLAR